MAISQNRPVVPPVPTDRSLGNFTSIVQKNLLDLHQAAHIHKIVTEAPAPNDGNIGDIYIVDTGITCYLTVKTADLGWVPQTGSVFNVKELGAKGDGTTDDTDAIQNAINITEASFGGMLVFPVGTYIITRALRVSKSIFIYGQGVNVDPLHEYCKDAGSPNNLTMGVAIYQRSINTDGIVFRQDSVYRIVSYMENMAFWSDGNNPANTSGDGIRVDSTDLGNNIQCNWKNVRVAYFGGYGMNFAQGYYSSTFEDIYCDGNGKTGFNMEGSAQGELIVKNLRCFGNGQLGLVQKDQAGLYYGAGGSGGSFYRVSCTSNYKVQAYFKGSTFIMNDFQAESFIGTPDATYSSLILESCSPVITGIALAPQGTFLGKMIDLRGVTYAMLTGIAFFSDTDPTGYQIFENSCAGNFYSYYAQSGPLRFSIDPTSWITRAAEGMSFRGRDEIFTGIKDNANGLKLGNIATITSNMQIYHTSAPPSGTWRQGDIVWNIAPISGGFAGFICVASGTPGTWKTFGLIS